MTRAITVAAAFLVVVFREVSRLRTSRSRPTSGGARALDYTFVQVTARARGAYAAFGTFGGDFSGKFGEVGYGFAVSEVHCTVGGCSAIRS